MPTANAGPPSTSSIGEGGEAVEDFSAGSGGGQYSGHAFGGAGFAGGFPLHDADGDGPGGGGSAFFVGGSAAGWGAPPGSATSPGPVHRPAAARAGFAVHQHLSYSYGRFYRMRRGTRVQEV